MIQKQFLSTLLWLIMVNLLIKVVFVFGIDMQVQHRVGQSAYGLYFVLLNLTYIFQIIHDFGLNLLHGTDTAHHGRIRREQWVSILKAKLGLSLLYAITVMGIAVALGYGPSWYLLIWLILNNVLISWIAVLRSGIAAMARYNAEGLISVMDKGLMIVICGALLLTTDDFQIEWFIWAQSISLVLTGLLAWRVSTPMWEKSSGTPDLRVTGILRDALPFSISVFLMFAYTRADSILIEQLLPDGTHQAGIYAAGFRLLDAANMMAFLFTPLLLPMYARLRHDAEGTVNLIRLARGMMVCMTTCISVTGYWWGPEIIRLCYGEQDAQWIRTFQWLILSHIPIGLMYIYGTYLTALRHLWPQNFLFIGMVILNNGVNLYTIPRWGTEGAAATALLTQYVTSAGLILLVIRYMVQKESGLQWWRPLAFLISAACAGWLVSSLTWAWWTEVMLFIVSGMVAAFLLKLLDLQAFMDVLKKRLGQS